MRRPQPLAPVPLGEADVGVGAAEREQFARLVDSEGLLEVQFAPSPDMMPSLEDGKPQVPCSQSWSLQPLFP